MAKIDEADLSEPVRACVRAGRWAHAAAQSGYSEHRLRMMFDEGYAASQTNTAGITNLARPLFTMPRRPVDTDFGEALERRMQNVVVNGRRLSIRYLARAVGVHPTTIQNLIAGYYTGSVETRKRISDIMTDLEAGRSVTLTDSGTRKVLTEAQIAWADDVRCRIKALGRINDFANAVGCSPKTLYNICIKFYTPSVRLKERIETELASQERVRGIYPQIGIFEECVA